MDRLSSVPWGLLWIGSIMIQMSSAVSRLGCYRAVVLRTQTEIQRSPTFTFTFGPTTRGHTSGATVNVRTLIETEAPFNDKLCGRLKRRALPKLLYGGLAVRIDRVSVSPRRADNCQSKEKELPLLGQACFLTGLSNKDVSSWYERCIFPIGEFPRQYSRI